MELSNLVKVVIMQLMDWMFGCCCFVCAFVCGGRQVDEVMYPIALEVFFENAAAISHFQRACRAGVSMTASTPTEERAALTAATHCHNKSTWALVHETFIIIRLLIVRELQLPNRDHLYFDVSFGLLHLITRPVLHYY
jgi:hypothetical protein